MNYTLKTFVARDGERFSQLYEANASGFPLFYPTAFIARSIRPSTTHETQKVYLAAIKRVCEWETSRYIDLAKRFHSRKFLSAAEIDDLTNCLRASKLTSKASVISNAKYNTYVVYAAGYIRWLTHEVITDSNTHEVRDAVEAQNTMLLEKKKRKVGSKAAREQRIVSLSLPNETRSRLLDLFDQPFEGVRQAQNFGHRLRNILMLRVLYETGMRFGELLSLKLKHLIEASGIDSAYLDIERNHHDEFDARLHQPVAKTQGRRVPISENLEEQLINYRDNWRAEVPHVGFSEETFIFIVHRGGRSQGQALPKTAFSTGLTNLKQMFGALKPLHPHLLRHDWNYRFSKHADREGMSFEEERTLREQLMGWVPGSHMSTRYNRRHIEEKSHVIGRKIASDTARILQ
ncbi:site-specific integrase [Pseudomonas mandelii]|uniref:Phage integrase family protein n=1 Tax=Pseudomonas mandelii TaxID=75612 RepID=A0ABY0W160_9PSED|nr:site-specific integrase [Pseudomonas mandelii]TWS07799.1 site-specific integrase [Pseudomonas mandelii]SDU67956.1 Phage integrase family protein [Pseudomonas mandelii]